MRTKRSHEGYLLIDNRGGPGTPVAPEGSVIECPTYTCPHCHRVVIMNPDRTRVREYCPKCDHYICDQCGAVRKANGGECKTLNQTIEELQNAAARAGGD